MHYLFSTAQKPDGFADGTVMQSAYEVNDVAMFARAEVIPLVALCIDFEGWCAFFAQRGAVPIVNALYSCWHIALLLQIIGDRDLLDIMYFHCNSVLS